MGQAYNAIIDGEISGNLANLATDRHYSIRQGAATISWSPPPPSQAHTPPRHQELAFIAIFGPSSNNPLRE